MFSIGICPTCDAGVLGLRKCGVCRRVVVLCDECDAAWIDHRVEARGTRGDETMPCPGCQADLWSGGATWATPAEIKATTWCAGPDVTLTESEPFEPRR